MATVWVRIKAEGGPRWDVATDRWQQAGEVHCIDEDQLRLYLNHAEVIPDPSAPASPDAPEATEAEPATEPATEPAAAGTTEEPTEPPTEPAAAETTEEPTKDEPAAPHQRRFRQRLSTK